MNQIWQMWSGVLEDSVVESIITECDKFPIETAAMGVGGNTSNDQYIYNIQHILPLIKVSMIGTMILFGVTLQRMIGRYQL